MRRKGFTLLEATFAMALGMIVLAAGYSAYFSVTRADDVERRREMLTTSVQSAMAHIKLDIRAASRAMASTAALALATADGPVTYRNSARGIERISGHRRSLFKGATVSFAQNGRGVDIAIKAHANVHGRMIRVDLDCFVTPRNR
jgi:Tfp pilus assembly protein PilW